MDSIYSFTEKEMSGQTIDFNQYRGKVLLIVNTASKCGLAPQLEGLEALYQEYQSQGLAILGLPSNQFRQEIAADEISQYCQLHYGVTFPMTQPVLVNGEGEDPLFTYLKQAAGHGRIKWNYTKFLIGRNGQMIHRYAPTTAPAKMTTDIQKALNS
ncbi:glutathione peroxidase [Convivina intestini]|uniref:Glutathione peroxidase n=1 Tax=Convivina intestini TaxID=1505726 RepID=A0A2U1DBM4_9LACO|nr:glutathione peroxidase [Convivina intestini]PVY85057.1 glutathione peroxidase [Convivina intestini]CAH1853547.1 Glutathione peroxidase BsaA [Convivina intestini]SDB89016.1 glutathione peroxidase [Leuconostocaceae bacterium R-53105]